MGMRQAINDKCKDCIYDPLDRGNWRQQVEACTCRDCALWPYRPKSKSGDKLAPESPDTGDKPCAQP